LILTPLSARLNLKITLALIPLYSTQDFREVPSHMDVASLIKFIVAMGGNRI